MSEEEELVVLEIKPDEIILVQTNESYYAILGELAKNEEESMATCRVVIQDNTEHGVILPARIASDDGKFISFILPEQLCIFNPNKTYLLKAEVVLETELITPAFQPCQINLNGLLEPAKEEEEQEGEDNSEVLEEAVKESQSEEDPELDDVLNAIAPLPKVEVKKTKVEDIVKQLDEEFVKNALWKTQQIPQPKIQAAPIPIKEPEPPLNTETLVVKQKMKNLLRSMLG